MLQLAILCQFRHFSHRLGWKLRIISRNLWFNLKQMPNRATVLKFLKFWRIRVGGGQKSLKSLAILFSKFWKLYEIISSFFSTIPRERQSMRTQSLSDGRTTSMKIENSKKFWTQKIKLARHNARTTRITRTGKTIADHYMNTKNPTLVLPLVANTTRRAWMTTREETLGGHRRENAFVRVGSTAC